MDMSNKQWVGLYTQRSNAVRKYMDSKTEVTVNGESYKLADLIAAYQASLDARALANSKRAELKAALIDRNTSDKVVVALEEVLKAWVTTKFGLASQEALEFGFAPKKPRTKSGKKSNKAPEPAPSGGAAP